jgi:hypothetical protein
MDTKGVHNYNTPKGNFLLREIPRYAYDLVGSGVGIRQGELPHDAGQGHGLLPDPDHRQGHYYPRRQEAEATDGHQEEEGLGGQEIQACAEGLTPITDGTEKIQVFGRRGRPHRGGHFVSRMQMG